MIQLCSNSWGRLFPVSHASLGIILEYQLRTSLISLQQSLMVLLWLNGVKFLQPGSRSLISNLPSSVLSTYLWLTYKRLCNLPYDLPDLSVCTLHTNVLSRDLLPSLRLLHHRLGIHQAETIQVADWRKQQKVTGSQAELLDCFWLRTVRQKRVTS